MDNLKIILFLVSVGSSFLCGLSLVAESGGYSLVAVLELLIVMASLVEHGLQAGGLHSSCAQAQLLCGMGLFPAQGSNPCLLQWQAILHH